MKTEHGWLGAGVHYVHDDDMKMLDSLNILDILDILDMVPHTDTGSQFDIFARRSRREEEIGNVAEN